DLRAFEAPERARTSEWSALSKGEYERHVETDPLSGDVITRTRSGFDQDGRVALARLAAAGDIEGGDGTVTELRIHPDDPLRPPPPGRGPRCPSGPGSGAARGGSRSSPRSRSVARGATSSWRPASTRGREASACSTAAGTSACRASACECGSPLPASSGSGA